MPYLKLFAALLLVSSTLASAKEIAFRDDIKPDAKRITIPLKIEKQEIDTNSRSNNFHRYTNERFEFVETDADNEEWEYEATYEANLGYEDIVIYARPAKLNFIGTSHHRQYYDVKVIGRKDEVEEVLTDGLYSNNARVMQTYSIDKDVLNFSPKDDVEAVFGFHIHGSTNGRPLGQWFLSIDHQMTGSLLMDNAELIIKSTQLHADSWAENKYSVQLDPLDNMLPTTSASAKPGEIFRLRDSSVIIESLNTETMEMVLAVVDGDLTVKPRRELEIGAPLPDFIRVDLTYREFVSMKDLTRDWSKPVVFVFGNFVRGQTHYHQQTGTIPVGLSSLINMTSGKEDVSLVVVSNTVPVKSLFDDWINVDNYTLIADSSDVSHLRFVANDSGGFVHHNLGSQSTVERLTAAMDIPTNHVGILATSADGKLTYYNNDAGKTFSASIIDALNSLTKE